MGFFKSLFGQSSAPQPALPKKMMGQTHSVAKLIVRYGWTSRIEDIQGYPFGEKKLQLFLAKFANENFVFDGEVRSMLIVHYMVKRELTGEIWAILHDKSYDECMQEEKDFGEWPKEIGWIRLKKREDGRIGITVSKESTKERWDNGYYY